MTEYFLWVWTNKLLLHGDFVIEFRDVTYLFIHVTYTVDSKLNGRN